MATPRRIFRIYSQLGANAGEIASFLSAKGEAVPGTVGLLLARDTAKLLSRWVEEMHELCGVLDGTHADPYIMEATQCFYWAALFTTARGISWDELRFEDNRRLAATCGVQTVEELRSAVKRLAGLAPEAVKPEKLFLMWNVADRIYRMRTPVDKQWSLEQLMEADLQEMLKRPYLEPILAAVTD